MREIKFRVFDKDYRKMHIVGKDGHDSLTCWDGKIQYYNLQNGEGSGEHGSYILMQYTGLKDKNGKEIYENDIVIGSHRSQRDDERIFIEQQVSFLNGCYMFGNWNAHEYFNMHTGIEVIGNIYEHPHLLEVEE